MRFYGLAIASAFVLGACGGGEKGADSTAADTAVVVAPAMETPAAPMAGTMAPITGTTHEVKMVGDAQGYRFEPANLTIKAGDGVKFVMVSGGPHNVAFDAAALPADMSGQLAANMPNSTEFSSPMMMNANEAYTVSFANIKPGKYAYNCTPHIAMNMKGEITVQ